MVLRDGLAARGSSGKGAPRLVAQLEQRRVEASEHDCRAISREVGPRAGYVRGQGRRES